MRIAGIGIAVALTLLCGCDESTVVQPEESGGETTDGEQVTSGDGEQVESGGSGGQFSLAGSRWRYESVGTSDSYKVDFLTGGYFHRHKHTTATDKWKQSGDKVTMVINDNVQLSGRIINGHTVVGRGVNPGKSEWDFRLVRLPSLAEMSPNSSKVDFVGSKWKLDSMTGGSDTTVWILPERWHTKKDNNEAPDTWKKDGNKVAVSVNGGIADYDLTLIGNHTMFGKAKNKEGKSWHVRLVRAPSPAELSCGPRADMPLPGTVWKLESIGASVTPTWELLDGGRLHDKKSSGNAESETWKQDGSKIAVDINGGFAQYRGTLIGDHTIVGWATNKKKSKWWFRALRKPSPAEGVCGG
jgi:hypothetical protein